MSGGFPQSNAPLWRMRQTSRKGYTQERISYVTERFYYISASTSLRLAYERKIHNRCQALLNFHYLYEAI